MFKEEINRNNSPNSELAESGYTGLVIKIKFLEEGGGVTCGASVADRRIFLRYQWMNATVNFTPSQKGWEKIFQEEKEGLG